MKQRDLQRLLRGTNVEDLLDDGIENGSDLKSGKALDDSGPAGESTPQEGPETGAMQSSSRHVESPAERQAVEASRLRSVSWFGLMLGMALMISGILVFLFPRAIVVYHARITRLPSFAEYVSSTGSQVYAGFAVLFGLAICAFSLYRPRD